MHLIVARDAADAAQLAAREIAHACRAAIALHGRAVLALSGGETPWLMLQALRHESLAWNQVWVTQVDERVAAATDPRRNLGRMRELLVERGPLPGSNLLAMPVEAEDLQLAALRHGRALQRLAGTPVCLDLVQLGLGADGHTASLLPGDALLAESDHDVGISAEYQGLIRMSLTLPALRRARRVLWLVTGANKLPALRALLDGSAESPAVLLARADATVVADAAAVGEPLGP